MKIQILCVLLLSAVTQLSANYDVIPATIVKKNGEVLKGDVKHDAYHELTKGVLFIDKVYGSKTFVDAADIQSLTLYDQNEFVSHEIQVEERLENRLLHIINGGKINLLAFYSRTSERLFVQKEGGQIEELEQTVKYITGIKSTTNRFRTVLSKLIYDKEDLLLRATKLNFKKSSISKLINDYNQLFGESRIDQKQKDFKTDLAIGATYALAKSSVADDFGTRAEGLTGFSFNAELAMYDPNISNAFTVHAGVRYIMATYSTGSKAHTVASVNPNGNTTFANQETNRSTVTETAFGVPIFIRMNGRKKILSPLVELGAFIGSANKMESFTGSGTIRETKYSASTPIVNIGIAVNLSEKHFVSLFWGTQYKFAAKAEVRF